MVSLLCMLTIMKLRPTNETKYIVWFVMTFALMQIADALIWHGIQTHNDILNAVVSQYVIPIILAAELLVAYYAAKYYLNWSNQIYEGILWLGVLYLLIIWVYECKDSVSKRNKDGNLVWCNRSYSLWSRVAFLILLLFPLIVAYPNGWIKYAVLFVGIASWTWNLTNSAFGSRWCWASNLLSIVILMFVLLKRK